MTRVALGIDLGTSSVKVVAVDQEGRVSACSQVSYPVLRRQPGWAEQDPFAWWQATCDAVSAVLTAGSYEVAAVGVGGQMHGLVALDRTGCPVRPAIIWSDTRSEPQARAWSRLIDPARVEYLTGMPIAPGMLGVSLSWVRDNEPVSYQQVSQAVSPKDYIRFRLTGVAATEPTDAAGGLLYDIRRGAPASEIADAVGLDLSVLAPIGVCLSVAGEVTRQAAADTGLPVGVPVAFGGGDQAMGAIALGLRDADRAAVAISSGGTVFKRTDGPLDPDHGLHVMPSAWSGEWMAMGVVLAAGLSVDWLISRVFGDARSSERIAELMAQAAQVPVGADGLLSSPHLGGTRTPQVDPSARASFFGLGFAHGQAHLVRALVEGVCISLASALQSMARAGDPARRLVVSGGGARFPLWRQTLADVTGLPVQVSSDLEHSAIGAALAGAHAAALDVAFDPASRVETTVQPDSTAHEAYQSIAARLRDVERAVRSAEPPTKQETN